MNSKFIATALLATVASFGAYADEADGSQFALKFEGNRTRVEVQAEAANVVRNPEPAGSRVLARVQSVTERATVRAEAAEAVRLVQAPRGGEASYM